MPTISEPAFRDLKTLCRAARTVFRTRMPLRDEQEVFLWAGVQREAVRIEKTIKPRDFPILGKMAKKMATPITFDDAMNASSSAPEDTAYLCDGYMTFLFETPGAIAAIVDGAAAEAGHPIDSLHLMGAARGMRKQHSERVMTA